MKAGPANQPRLPLRFPVLLHTAEPSPADEEARHEDGEGRNDPEQGCGIAESGSDFGHVGFFLSSATGIRPVRSASFFKPANETPKKTSASE